MDAIGNQSTETAGAAAEAQDKPALLTPAQAQQKLVVSAPMLRKLAREGAIKSVRYSHKCIRYNASDVERVAAEGVPAVQTK